MANFKCGKCSAKKEKISQVKIVTTKVLEKAKELNINLENENYICVACFFDIHKKAKTFRSIGVRKLQQFCGILKRKSSVYPELPTEATTRIVSSGNEINVVEEEQPGPSDRSKYATFPRRVKITTEDKDKANESVLSLSQKSIFGKLLHNMKKKWESATRTEQYQMLTLLPLEQMKEREVMDIFNCTQGKVERAKMLQTEKGIMSTPGNQDVGPSNSMKDMVMDVQVTVNLRRSNRRSGIITTAVNNS